jgi:tRNA (guanine-N7-)-methyltransferase
MKETSPKGQAGASRHRHPAAEPSLRRSAEALSPTSLLHGRRKGKKLGVRHTGLLRDLSPAVTFDASRPIPDPANLFAGRPAPLWLEIGFGSGEHLAAAACRHPQVNFIGCESFLNGIAKALELIEDRGLGNIRLHDGDARTVIEALPAQSVERVYLLYPDPWPKRRQHKRRFVSEETLASLARIMCPGAELRFATDVDDYAGWTLARVLASPDFAWRAEAARDWQEPWPEWPGTRYEAKAKAEGRRPAYLAFLRTSDRPTR